MRRWEKALWLLVLITVPLATFSTSVGAHAANDWFPASWGANHFTVDWRFGENVPSGAYRDRIISGPAAWNNLNRIMTFNRQTPDYASFSVNVCPNQTEKNGVHWGDYGSSIAFTVLCTFQDAGGSDNSHLHSFQIGLNKFAPWYTGTGGISCTPTCRADLWSVAVHEFGHATGRGSTKGELMTAGDGDGHFPMSWSVCDLTQSDYHSMCAMEAPGETWGRSLNTHDIDTFKNRYGLPPVQSPSAQE